MNVQVNTVLMNTPFRGIDKLNEVYFIGIGEIGMSAIARFFHAGGVKVSGYDKTPTVLTNEMEASGVAVHYEENVELVPKNPDLVVYTPAIPAEHKELVYFREKGAKVVKRSDVLQIITESSFNICIAGTHGKTTITSMVAHLLRDSGFGCNAFLGGISVNYGTNFWSSLRALQYHNADWGTAVVMEVKTGAIRAIANLGKNEEGWFETYNYAVGYATEPGSTFKLASMMALLEDNMINLEDSVSIEHGVTQYYDDVLEDSSPESKELDTITVRRAFEMSSNVGVSKMVTQAYGERNALNNNEGAARYIAHMKEFNLHLPTGIGIEGEASPYIKEAFSEKDSWSGTTLPWMSTYK